MTAAAPSTPTTAPPQPFDPLRLCIFATVALISWVAGPFAVLAFAALGFAGYWRARRAGLERSKCVLRDTRLVLAYLGLLALAGAAGAVLTTLEVLGVR
ncbi:hypothetical protein [Oryzobacter terrae]|uniref:hypothetical protein n=1 Tax=Oryzobacter terrae TaxID=1620385 RepID=UPI00366E0B55